MIMNITVNKLIEGDPLAPSDLDVIVQSASLNVGLPVPDGWRVMTGNMHTSLIMRIIYRYEEEAEEAA